MASSIGGLTREQRINAVLDMVMDSIGLDEACRRLGFSGRLFRKWVEEDSPVGLRDRYEQARRIQADQLRDVMLDVLRPPSEEEFNELKRLATVDFTLTNGVVVKRVDGRLLKGLLDQRVKRDEVKVRTLQWLMARAFPGRFGDKVGIELSGQVDLTAKMEGWSDEELTKAIQRQLKGYSAPVLGLGYDRGVGGGSEGEVIELGSDGAVPGKDETLQ